MDLTSSGRLVLWVGTCLLILGLVFSNPLILGLAGLLLLYLLLEAISFHRALDVFKNSVRLDTHPTRMETTVGRSQAAATVVENNSDMDFRVLRLSLGFSAEVHEDTPDLELLVQAQTRQRIVTVLETKVAGRFDTRVSTLGLGRRLFKHVMSLSNSVTILVRPIAVKATSLVETSGLPSVDSLRFGRGTDVAGLRTWNLADDYHTIDWKATARTGNLMSMDFYLERDPTIMLLVDASSSMRARWGDRSIFSALIGEIANFLGSKLRSSAIGLVLYDEKGVVANIEPRPGLKNRDTILRTLLERASSASAVARLLPQEGQLHSVLTNGSHARERRSSFAGKTKAIREHSSSFAGLVLPFYRKSVSRRLSKLRKEGVFRAFEIISDLPDPTLVIAISDGKTNWVGLCEGARYVAMLNHWVIVGILSWAEKGGATEPLPDFGSRVRAVRCAPEDLWRAVSAEILEASRARLIRESR